MEALRQVLLTHAGRYPAMEPVDAVKLLYQNEFGGGHLIRDEEACFDYLRREYDSITKNGNVIKCESIGNGIVRVHLAAVAPDELEQLGRDFIRSAAAHRGSMDSFLLKLEVLRKLTGEGVFAFGTEELEAYLGDYIRAGCPAVSHSEGYRKEYRPAYRVILAQIGEEKHD